MTVLKAGSATDVGQVRAVNQDAVLSVEEHSLFGVADGIGGHQGGEVASALAVETVGELATEPVLDNLVEAVRQANRRIFEQAGTDIGLHGMGTTFVALQVVDSPEGGEIGWVNVGDSRLYLFRDDEIVQLSEDHSLVEELVRDGRLTPEEAKIHPQRNVVTRSLGIDIDVAIDADRLLPFTGDRFLLCSDGLSNEVSSEQMSSVLRRLTDPGDAASELVRLANDAGGRDNITVVVVDVLDDDGRSQRASDILAAREEATAEARALPDVDDDDPFEGRASSLPDSDDDYGADSDDLFASMDEARTRRFTWRVAVFLLLLLGAVGVAIGGVGWSANHSYFVAYKGDVVAVFRGKPGGVLFFQPKVVRVSTVTRDQVSTMFRDDIAAGKTFSSEGAALRYVNRVTLEAIDPSPVATTTTTTTPATTTTTTTAPASTTTTAPGP